MKKFAFYLSLNVLNILLCFWTYIAFLVFFITCYLSTNVIAPICIILLCILVKIFFLYVLFVIFERFFPNLKLSQVVKELKTNKSSRKSALLLAFAYDVVIMLCGLLLSILKEYHIEWAYGLVYEILTLGGVCMFYIPLFLIWKVQNKLNKE